ncbi:Predicted arabinose efflux permease, MFS family [Hymenobacter daecheongensis DSM 21074]|uniref:Predicted arabinose efflux permease, MFS family n=1 Tax=Hymenobacter daecheongensis DSM 21074 TaxID=1121955 RepID=A0A1M6GJV4_9BACT|nr:MFS transporter [Hymenobacter daecheongensis]SHJ10237.1 Predicted arabinose efflux permease, MFS family [Hymenobacter daecheongensis DSM 21074]
MPLFKSKVYTAGFWLMCLSSFLFFMSFNMLLPELPDFLTRLGGAEYKGFIIASFTLTAGLSRPFSGKLADTVGRIPVMVFGSLICFVCGFFYPWVTTVGGFLLLRLLHGFSTGFKPTGTAAFIADIIPYERRGEAMGLLGVAGSLGMAAGPALGPYITAATSLDTLFYASSGLALLSLAVQGTMTETLPAGQRQRFRWHLLRLNWHEVLEPQVFGPALVTLLCLFPFGAILTVIPDQSQALGLKAAEKGLFFTCFTLASLLVRLVAGRASDRYGRVPVLRVSTVLLATSLLLLTLAASKAVFLGAALLFGIASGLNSPTLYAWTIDLSHPERRGRAVATMYIALEAGIGLGALLAGWIFGNVAAHLPYVHALSTGCTLLALGYLVWGLPKPRVAGVA